MSRQFLNGIDLASQRITSVASPTASTDAANKGYVDNALAGLAWKADVVAATTTNGTLATSFANGSVVDGVTLATGQRILIKNQTTQSQNGIYVVNASGAPTLAYDFATAADADNATVSVLGGTVNALTSWTQTTPNPTIGTSNIVWAAFAAGAVYTAGNGLQLASGVFSALLNGGANSGLTSTSSGLAVNPGAGITTSGGSTAISLAGTNPALSTASGLAVVAGTGITVASNNVAVDTTVVSRHYATSIGDGSTLTYTVTHGLGTLDVIAQVYANSGGAQVEADIVHASTTTITVGFAVAPSSNQYRVVVMG